jgi:hypothetical protein
MATSALQRSRRAQHRSPHLRVVEGQRTAARRPSPWPIVVLVVLAVFGVAALQAWVGQDGLRAAALEREVAHEQERLTLLRAQVAQLSSPQRLREEALKLGLVPAAEPVFLPVTVPPATAASLSADAAKRLESPSP